MVAYAREAAYERPGAERFYRPYRDGHLFLHHSQYFVLGFYEADVVKTAPRKSVFKVFGLFRPGSGHTLTVTGLWCLMGAVRATSTVMIKQQSQLLSRARRVIGSRRATE